MPPVPAAESARAASGDARDSELELQLSSRARQVEALSRQVSELNGMLQQLSNDQTQDASVETIEPKAVKRITYKQAQTWSTPEEVAVKKQQREIEKLRGEVTSLRSGLSEMVELQREQLQQMKKINQPRSQDQPIQAGNRVPDESVETITPVVFPSRVVAPNPFETTKPQSQPRHSESNQKDRRGAEAHGVQGTVASSIEGNQASTESQSQTVLASGEEQTPVSTMQEAKPRTKGGLLTRLKKGIWKSNSQKTVAVTP